MTRRGSQQASCKENVIGGQRLLRHPQQTGPNDFARLNRHGPGQAFAIGDNGAFVFSLSLGDFSLHGVQGTGDIGIADLAHQSKAFGAERKRSTLCPLPSSLPLCLQNIQWRKTAHAQYDPRGAPFVKQMIGPGSARHRALAAPPHVGDGKLSGLRFLVDPSTPSDLRACVNALLTRIPLEKGLSPLKMPFFRLPQTVY